MTSRIPCTFFYLYYYYYANYTMQLFIFVFFMKNTFVIIILIKVIFYYEIQFNVFNAKFRSNYVYAKENNVLKINIFG